MDKTLKLHAYSEPAKPDVAQGNPKADQSISLELAKKTALLEEERSKSLELLKTIVQLRESLKQEQVKTSEIVRKAGDLEAQAKEFAAADANELASKTAQLEEEKKQSLDFMRRIEQLKESLKQEQAKKTDVVDKTAELEAKTKEVAVLEEKLNNLSAVLNTISRIAATGKLDSDA